MAPRTLAALHLCSGYGGFELALRGLPIRTVAHVEREAYAASILVERMGQARLDQAPVWDDLCTFNGYAWRGRVDLITAGFPCQPFSSAGKQLGLADDRWLWPEIARICREVRPGWIFLENVPGLVRAGLPEVLSDLASLGFDAEWGLLSAAAVGAPHKRERFWLVGHAQHSGLDGTGVSGFQGCGDVGAAGAGEALGHANGQGRPEVTRGSSGDEGTDGGESHGGHVPDGPGQDVADAPSVDEREPHHQARPESWGLARRDVGWRFPPARDDLEGWREYLAQGGPEPVVRRITDGPLPGLADALHLGGNGLVPQCARAAFDQLLARGGWELT